MTEPEHDDEQPQPAPGVNEFTFKIIAEAEVTPGPETLARMAAEQAAEEDDGDRA